MLPRGRERQSSGEVLLLATPPPGDAHLADAMCPADRPPPSCEKRFCGYPHPMRANAIRELLGGTPRQRRDRSRTASGLLITLLLVSAACTGPARTTSAYQSKAVDTADEVVSASRTVLLAAQLGDEGRSFAPTISVTVANAETDAETARDAFTSVQPPNAESDNLRAALLPTVQDACDVIGEVRIAARRADGDLSQVAAPLGQLADELDAFSTRYG